MILIFVRSEASMGVFESGKYSSESYVISSLLMVLMKRATSGSRDLGISSTSTMAEEKQIALSLMSASSSRSRSYEKFDSFETLLNVLEVRAKENIRTHETNLKTDWTAQVSSN